jgi:hemoglobin/transferrin/lactoferrin receptor protein
MYERSVRCSQGSVVEHVATRPDATRPDARSTGANNRSHLIRKGLLLGCGAAASLALTAQAIAQSSQTLPQVTVEGKKGSTAKKSTAKGAPKAAAKQAEPVQQAETQAAKEKAQKDAVYNTPAAVSTATKSELDTFGQVDTGDVLRTMPGTFTRESPQNPGLAVNIRGLEGSGRVNMMIDGVRQNFRFSGHEAQGFVYVDPSLLAGVDVARGAISTVGGAGALVGSANLRTLGVEDIVKPGNATGVLSTLTYGTNGVGWSEMLAAGATNGTMGVAGAISHHEPDNYKNGSGLQVPNTRQDLISGLFKMDFRISAEQSLKFGVVRYDNDFFSQSALQNVQSNTYTAKYAYRPIDNPLIDLRVNAAANEVRMHLLQGTGAGRVIKDTGMGGDISNTSRFNFGQLRVAATYGYEYFFDNVDAFNKINPGNGGGSNASGESQIGGAFSQTQFTYGIFDLITGLRYDTYAIDGTFTAQAGNPLGLTPGLYNLDNSDGRLSPKVTLAAQVLPWLQPYVTYAEAFRAPTINETMFGGSHPGGGLAGFGPNPFLDPEIQKGWEFGFNIRKDRLVTRNDSFRLKAGYYTMDVENYITACSNGGPTFFCNTPGAKVQGVEVEGMYDAGYFFAGLSYTYSKNDLPSQLDGAGAHSYLPEHTAIGTVGARFFDQKLTIGTRVSYFSESFVGDVNVGSFYGGSMMPGYTLVDLFTSYKLTSNIELGATVTNLFDVDYTPALSTPLVPFGPVTPTNCFGSNVSPLCNDNGRGRTGLVTVKAHF